ncbi:MAG TPA: hypothetical protein VKQ28_06960 [Candidatus Acidoferrum sp.]|nr:hypothetical protein [Candidatus Acidoferrum sp.]
MQGFWIRLWMGLFANVGLAESGFAHGAPTWHEVRDKFELANPSLQLNLAVGREVIQ